MIYCYLLELPAKEDVSLHLELCVWWGSLQQGTPTALTILGV